MLLVLLLPDLCFRSDLSFLSELGTFTRSRLTVLVLVFLSFSKELGLEIHFPSEDLVGPVPSRKLSVGMAEISDCVLGSSDPIVLSAWGMRGLAGRRRRPARPMSIPMSIGWFLETFDSSVADAYEPML